MSCPRCGYAELSASECPRCGVVFAKLDRPVRPAAKVPVHVPTRSTGPRFSLLDATLWLALVISAGVIASRWTQPPPASRARAARPASGQSAPERFASSPGTVEDAPAAAAHFAAASPEVARAGPVTATQVPNAGEVAQQPEAWQPSEQMTLLNLQQAREVEPSHIAQAEALHESHPGDVGLSRLVLDLLSRAAAQAQRRGQPAEGARYLERATELFPDDKHVWQALVAFQESNAAWQAAEHVARRGVSALPGEESLHLAIANALSRQGRDDEAIDLLRRRLADHDDSRARALLARLERGQQSVAGLTRRTTAHFSIRFEGEPDDALGKALTRLLEEKFVMLARTLDCEPGHEVPVILYPRQTFRAISDAPNWAAGYYSHGDTRIRIGTQDLSAGFVPVDLERTLTHELVHAFVHARTRGAIPDDINEGLAQYLSGRRLGYQLDASRAVVRDGQMKVRDFYDSALSFVEYLLEHYRQSTMNDLLKYAGDTGSADQAFRRAYHQSYDETREEWIKHLR